jgi:hypothetical protein
MDIDEAVLAVAGRRVDEAGSPTVRFPLDRIPLVRREIRELLIRDRVMAVVSSAACGADLLALAEAERFRLTRRIVLPFPRGCFRAKSVIDRPGDWGETFDRLTAKAKAECNLTVLDVDTALAYSAANSEVLDQASHLASSMIRHRRLRRLALVVWEGAPRPGNDATEQFRQLAVGSRFELRTILTRSGLGTD